MNGRIVAGIAGATMLAAAAWFGWPRPESESAATPPGSATQSPEITAAAPGATRPPPRWNSLGADPAVRPADSVVAAQDPEGEARLRAHFERLVSVIYEDVRTELGMNDDQNEALMALLVEQQMRRFAQEFPDTPEKVASYNALEALFVEELEGEIGVEGARAFAEYRRTENARYEVDDLRRWLEEKSAPLTEAQRKSLIRGAIDRGAYVTFPRPTAETLGMAALQEMYARFEQRDQKLLNVARGILDARQMAITETAYSNRQVGYDEMLQNAGKQGVR